MSLPPAVRYPYHAAGPYSTAPLLRPLGTDFGNGRADATAFVLDADWPRFRDLKLSLDGRRDRHVGSAGLTPEVAAEAYRILAQRLADDHPDLFRFETLGLRNPQGTLITDLDGLLLEVPEDLALVVGGRCVYVNVSAPSHWNPIEKLGKDFAAVHAPVPHMERTVAAADGLNKAMTERGPWVRFVWTLEPDDVLNHHPDLGEGARDFSAGRFWVRVERQTTLPMPQIDGFAFLIRVTFVPDDEILARANGREELLAALDSLPEASRVYKGLPPGAFAQARALVATQRPKQDVG